MIEKTYQPGDVEQRIYAMWEKAGAFRAGRPERADAKPYSIVIPPPNVTGSLHMGHALNNTLQDILCRFERMRGKDVLWQPGTDHAGIATQMVVERQLAERQLSGRREMGREAFLKRVWEWKADSGGTIVNQLKRLGASCDWSRERFTMDEGLSRAVLKVFVDLYRDGLIYKDKRLVNWDPKLLTAISDLEVMQVESKGSMWHFRYPLADDPTKFLVIATTRPETMLGDGAVAVHPDDERYKHLVGKLVTLPLANRLIPVIADEYPDPEKGSGAVKITAAHDFNDFDVWSRHRDEDYFKSQKDGGLINLFTPEAKLNENCPEQYRGLDRYEARKRIIADLEAAGLVEKIEKVTHVVPHGDRSNVVIEPYLTEQWYVNAQEMAKPAIAAVREGKTKFVPDNWEKTYFNWMENIQPWCISRQLWWGHQIPAWYGPDGKVFVELTEAQAKAEADKHYGKATSLTRDEDVLDTWFSSALWPFSTLGWPDKTPELARFYPTHALVTGFDIIFFWVARMMMMGLHFMQKERPGAPLEEVVPFKDVYIHRLVRDASGQKMSKSKGNVVDPLGLIDQYGADALRFALARGAAQGHDIRLGPSDVENNRNFATKLWNAARFIEFNGAGRVAGFDPKSVKEVLNRWIVHETAKASRVITEAIAEYRFNDAAAEAYRFVWNVYCDWYIELAKPILLLGTWIDNAIKMSASEAQYENYTPDQIYKAILSPTYLLLEADRLRAGGQQGADLLANAAKSIQAVSSPQVFLRQVSETRATAAWAFDEILKLLHPFMPFITEELWAVAPGPARSDLLALSQWPQLEGFADDKAEAEIGFVIDLITEIRSIRSTYNVPASAKVSLGIVTTVVEHSRSPSTGWTAHTIIERWGSTVAKLANLSQVDHIAHLGQLPGQVNLLVRQQQVVLNLADAIDLPTEILRLEKEMAKIDADINRIDTKFLNEKFVANARQEILEEEKEKRVDAVARKDKIAAALARLRYAT